MIDGATGPLLAWTPDHAQVAGLAAVAFHDLVEIEGCGPALVTVLRRAHTWSQLCCSWANVSVEVRKVREATDAERGPLHIRRRRSQR